MIVLFLLGITVVIILNLTSRDKYKTEIELIGDNKLKLLMPMGLQMVQLIILRCPTRYRKTLETKLRELHGERDVYTFFRLHLAQKFVLMLLALIFTAFVGTQVEMDSTYTVFALGLPAVLFYITDRQLDDKIKARRRGIQLEFPEFLNKLILLVNAGLTVSGAVRKIVRDNKKDSPLYTELRGVINEVDCGKSDIQAYESFARRCRVQEVTIFTGVLVQNLRKGNDELIPILRIQANSCWENRKNIARRLGEEASTRLLIPMIIAFIAILIMIITPAVLQINI